jgi:hypothetical protein
MRGIRKSSIDDALRITGQRFAMLNLKHPTEKTVGAIVRVLGCVLEERDPSVLFDWARVLKQRLRDFEHLHPKCDFPTTYPMKAIELKDKYQELYDFNYNEDNEAPQESVIEKTELLNATKVPLRKTSNLLKKHEGAQSSSLGLSQSASGSGSSGSGGFTPQDAVQMLWQMLQQRGQQQQQRNDPIITINPQRRQRMLADSPQKKPESDKPHEQPKAQPKQQDDQANHGGGDGQERIRKMLAAQQKVSDAKGRKPLVGAEKDEGDEGSDDDELENEDKDEDDDHERTTKKRPAAASIAPVAKKPASASSLSAASRLPPGYYPEKKSIKGGREYTIYHGPNGERFPSVAAVLRHVGQLPE